MWTTFYHKMFLINQDRMVRRDIETVLKQTTVLFGIGMRYYSPHEGGVKRIIIKKDGTSETKDFE